MIRINDIIENIQEKNRDADVDIVNRAYIFSAQVHAGQTRLSGEPYLSHPLEVAGILADMNLDVVSVAAGLLHDVIEDTDTTEETIREMFGDEVFNIVQGVTKLSKLAFTSSEDRQAESIRKMLLAMASDIRVILIKLADRLHNMKTLRYHKNEDKRKRIAQETLDIYAPIASRLGIYWIKRELEDISFKYIDPDNFDRIQYFVEKDMTGRGGYIEEVRAKISELMAKANLKCEVLGRYKHFYSISQKMYTQSLDFDELYDIIAFRLLMHSQADCYNALGIIHSHWKPIDRKFKDYIGRPKPNMYQSLHTSVFGPGDQRIEIQIRTYAMDEVAKSGIAAHWSYKEGKTIDDISNQKFAWIQNIIENQENTKDPNEFLENVKIDLFPDEVYVFTPNGEVKTMPKGATPVDFAYMIHTEVGNTCTGAKVNGVMAPLKYQLKTGDVVKIITTKGHHPSRDWLNFVKTVKARSRIRQWIKIQEKARSMTLGREMCEKEFRKYKLNYNDLTKSEGIDEILENFGYQTLDDLVAAVGYGKITPLQIVRKIIPKTETEEDEKPGSILNRLIGRVRKKKPGGVLVRGMDDILVKFGKCCNAVPGDPIIGYITRGYGVTVHKVDCVNALKMNPERRIAVEWNQGEKEKYPVRIHVQSHDRVGLLADLAMNITKCGANILAANSETKENKIVNSFFTITVEDTRHLNVVIAAIKKVKMVGEVRRITG